LRHLYQYHHQACLFHINIFQKTYPSSIHFKLAIENKKIVINAAFFKLSVSILKLNFFFISFYSFLVL
jgi:hypothetical protein